MYLSFVLAVVDFEPLQFTISRILNTIFKFHIVHTTSMIIKKENDEINTQTKATYNNIVIFSILSSLLILGLSLFSVQTSLAQVNENIPLANTSSETFTTDNKKILQIPSEVIVVAEDVEEIKDNLQKARQALNDANYLKVLSHIDNIDQLLTVIVGNSVMFINNTTSNSDSTSSSSSSSLISPKNDSSMLKEEYNKLITIKNISNDAKSQINEELFIPNNLTISKGSSITWINKDNLPHTITLKKLDEQPREFKFALSLGDSYKHTFDEAGVYGFYSNKSPWSEGKIIVS